MKYLFVIATALFGCKSLGSPDKKFHTYQIKFENGDVDTITVFVRMVELDGGGLIARYQINDGDSLLANNVSIVKELK